MQQGVLLEKQLERSMMRFYSITVKLVVFSRVNTNCVHSLLYNKKVLVYSKIVQNAFLLYKIRYTQISK